MTKRQARTRETMRRARVDAEALHSQGSKALDVARELMAEAEDTFDSEGAELYLETLAERF